MGLPPSSTYVRFSSLMELRMNAGFRDREICTMSCSSARHRAGVGQGHAAPTIPQALRENLGLCPPPYYPTPSRSTCLLPPEGLFVLGHSRARGHRALGVKWARMQRGAHCSGSPCPAPPAPRPSSQSPEAQAPLPCPVLSSLQSMFSCNRQAEPLTTTITRILIPNLHMRLKQVYAADSSEVIYPKG